MAKKMILIRKAPMKTLVPKILNGVLRDGACVGTAYLSNKVLSGKMEKIKGPAAMLIGLAGDIFIENEHIRAVAQGIGAAGALGTVGVLMPAKKADFGLAGVEDQENNDPNGDENGVGDLDWNQLANEAMHEVDNKGTSGVDDEGLEDTSENVSGVEDGTQDHMLTTENMS